MTGSCNPISDRHRAMLRARRRDKVGVAMIGKFAVGEVVLSSDVQRRFYQAWQLTRVLQPTLNGLLSLDEQLDELRHRAGVPTASGSGAPISSSGESTTPNLRRDESGLLDAARIAADRARNGSSRLDRIRADLSVTLDEERRRPSHRSIRPAKILMLLFLVVIDFPILLWLTSSVFNVDWGDPLGLPLAASIVISILGIAGVAWALYHLGYKWRETKNDRRRLEVWGRSRGRAGARRVDSLDLERAFSDGVRAYQPGLPFGSGNEAVAWPPDRGLPEKLWPRVPHADHEGQQTDQVTVRIGRAGHRLHGRGHSQTTVCNDGLGHALVASI